MAVPTTNTSKLRRAKRFYRSYIPYLSGTFAIICGVGIGFLLVSTVMSTPVGLLAYLFSGLVFTYGTAGFFQWQKKKDQEKKLAEERENSAENTYINDVLQANKLTVDKNYKGETKNFVNYFHSFVIGGILALSAFYFVTQVLIAFAPPFILMASVAAVMFCTMTYVLSKNFHGGIKNVANNLLFALNPELESELNPDAENEISPNVESRNTIGWRAFKVIVGTIGIISCIAAGIVAGALTQGGVATALSGDLGFSISMAGPVFGWVVLVAMVVSVAAMMAWGLIQWLKDNELDKKAMVWYSLFDRPKYLAGLETEFENLNDKITVKTGQLNEARAGHPQAFQDLQRFQRRHQEQILNEDELDEFEILSKAEGLVHKRTDELDSLYKEKDMVYHRYQMFQSRLFQVGFAVTTVLVTAFCLFGMLIHMARGSQSFATTLTQIIPISEAIAMTTATAFMWVAMFTETIFTATSASNAVTNDVAVGTQTDQYNALREKQQTPSKLMWDFFFHTARVIHGMFDGLLALFGSTGSASKPSESYAQNDIANQVASAGSATRAATENLVSDDSLKLDYQYNDNQMTVKPLRYSQLYPPKEVIEDDADLVPKLKYVDL